ncbi:DUF7261 family protein [Haloplanus sp. C73]|uniref:DUF7261 family protein n=1 Tax=Haloplanus sp. C73 TaxID=3421641 RepID=UPI003EBDEB3D
MADVTDRDRAQLLLVGALALAVVFLSLSLLLNSVIYTENLATRQTHADAEKANSFHTAVVDGLGGAIEYANRRNTTTLADRRDAYRNSTDALILSLANYSATDGVAAGVERQDIHEGTRIVDANESTAVVNRDGARNWTLVNDSRVRAFRLQVNVSSVESGDDPVRFKIDNGTTREIIVERVSGDARVRIERAGTTTTCALNAGRIDITSGSIDGEYCRGLADSRPDEPVNVSVVNGGEMLATYSLVVDRQQAGLRTAVDIENFPGACTPPSPPTYGTSRGDDPYTAPAIYATTAEIDTGTKNLDFSRSVRAAPDEPGPPATGPTFSEFNVTPGETFTIDWAASDPNDDIDSVTIELEYAINGTTFDTQSYTSVTADSTTFTGVPNDTAYYVRGTVTDGTTPRRVTTLHDTGGCPP